MIEHLLAATWASRASFEPLDEETVGHDRDVLDVLEHAGLLGPAIAAAWRSRLDRLARDSASSPPLPEDLRAAARAYLSSVPEQRRAFTTGALDAIGALGWRDHDELGAIAAVTVERVYAVPARTTHGVTISSLVVYGDAIEIYWYAEAGAWDLREIASGRPGAPPSPLGLALRDDRDGAYRASGSGHSGDPGIAVGRTLFTPAPRRDAAWVEVTRNGDALVRVPLT